MRKKQGGCAAELLEDETLEGCSHQSIATNHIVTKKISTATSIRTKRSKTLI